ncbi:MAG: DUF4261 domain-containing protein [Lachnospiraceae bacterium]|nr:DUF4261 domain-containing protein [Ruminococcus sp.]MCM1274869.1 DUF4261 domain-containing protein [Lachnospiraceae bacterium]
MGLFKNEKTPNGKNGDFGSFAGFALLSEPKFDRKKFYADLKADWGVNINDSSDLENDVIYADIDGYRLVVGIMPTPVPDGEAEYWAKGNYMWQDAVEVTASHKAHAIIAVLGKDDDLIGKGNLYVQAVCAMMKQESALAFYNEGAVFPAKMYLDFAGLLRDGHVPVLNLVWLGIFGDGKQAGVYTYGMRRMGREEIEVYVSADKADLNELREFMLAIASYVLETGAELKDGETIGFTEEQKLPITLSKGVAVDGSSLKIGYEKK